MHALAAGLLRHLLGQRVGHGLGDERLAASRRAVEQDPLRWLQLVLLEQLRVEERELHGVADVLDLRPQAPDVLVADVWDLLEDGLLHLLLRELLQGVVRLRVEQHGVSGPNLSPDGGSQHRDGLFVPPAHDHRAILAEELLDGHHLAGDVVLQHLDHVEGFVEDDLDALHQMGAVDLGVDVHPHLPPRGEHIHGLVVVLPEVDPEGGGRLGELLDLLLQGFDLLPLGLQRGHELLVLRRGAHQIASRLEDLLLQNLHLPGRVRQTTPEQRDLILEELRLGLELVDLLLVPLQLLLGIGALRSLGHPHHSSLGLPGPRNIPPGSRRSVRFLLEHSRPC